MKGKYLKCGVVFLVVLALLQCKPVVLGEKIGLDWIWSEIGFWPALEEEVEIPEEKQKIYMEEIESHPSTQFSPAEEDRIQMFLYEGKEYGLSPETGILFIDDDFLVKLTDAYGKYDGLYALGVIQKGNMLYYAQAKERKWLWLPGLFNGDGILSECYQVEYRKCYLTGNIGWEPSTEEEYMAVQAEKRYDKGNL